MKKITIPVGGRPSAYNDDIGSEMLILRKNGMTIKAISEKYGVSVSTCKRWLQKAKDAEKQTGLKKIMSIFHI